MTRTVPYSAIMQIESPGAYTEGWLKEGARVYLPGNNTRLGAHASAKYIHSSLGYKLSILIIHMPNELPGSHDSKLLICAILTLPEIQVVVMCNYLPIHFSFPFFPFPGSLSSA